MLHKVCVGLVIVLALNSISEAAKGSKDQKATVGTKRALDNEYENVNSEIYKLISTITKKKSSCVETVTVTGKGVGDVFNKPCSPKGLFSIVNEKYLVYGNPEKDSFNIYSDQPSSLTLYQDGKCTKRTYKTESKKTFAEISTMSDEECKLAQSKVNKMIQEESKFLEVVDNKVEELPQKGSSNYKGWKPKFAGNS